MEFFVPPETDYFLTEIFENDEAKMLTPISMFLWIQIILLLSVLKTPDQQQTITHADLLLPSSTKWYQKSRTLNDFVQSSATGYADWILQCWNRKKKELADDKDTISPQFFPKTNARIIFRCLSLTFVWVETGILQGVPPLSSLCPLGQHNYQVRPITQPIFFCIRVATGWGGGGVMRTSRQNQFEFS